MAGSRWAALAIRGERRGEEGRGEERRGEDSRALLS
jgi:hypothetical protein